MSKFSRAKAQQAESQKIAKERIAILFGRAEAEFAAGRSDLADRYVKLARLIGMKTNVPIPARFKRRYCKKCMSFLVPGKNARVRLRPKQKIILQTCLVCGNETRLPYSKK